MAESLSSGPIVLVVALDAEIQQLVRQLRAVEPRTSGIWNEWHARVGSRDVLIVRSGVGMTAGAAATEHAISAYEPACVLNYGSAGAHVRDVLPGDIVIANRVIACNTLLILATGEELFIERHFHVEGQEQDRGRSVTDCDPSLIGIAQDVSTNWEPIPWPDRFPQQYPLDRDPVVRTGAVISADIWVQSPDRIDALHRRHRSLAADMEAAAIGQVADMHGRPFLAIKDISNNELFVNTDINVGEILAPLGEVGKRSASFTHQVLEAIGGDAR